MSLRLMIAGAVMACGVAVSLAGVSGARAQAIPPAVGEKAPDFTLDGLDGAPVTLSAELQRGPVVLVLLRGWPNYQCPFCVRQYGDFIGHRAELAAAGARVIWIYPGAADVKLHADAFVARSEVPPNFRLALDPAYAFTNAYRLRWEGKDETTYPSTFVIDRRGVIRWALVSREHGGRAAASDVVAALANLPR